MRQDLLAGLDPRAKFVAFLAVQALIFIPGAKPSTIRLGSVAIPLLFLLPFAGKSWKLWLRTLTLAAPLLAFLAASAFLPLHGSTKQSACLALWITGKSALVFLALALFVLNEDPWRFLQAVRQAGLPRAAAVVLALGYRFAGQLRLELEGWRRAWTSRNFAALSRMCKIRAIIRALPLFFERLLDASVHVHDAMVSRGFQGSLPSWQRLVFCKRDVAFLALVALTTMAIVIPS